MNHEGPSLPRVSPLGMTGIVIFAFVLAIDALALGVRLRSRSLQGLSLCFNDYAVLLAWPPTAVSFVLDVLVTIRGADGQHLVDVSPTEVTFFLKTVPIGGLLWITANTLIKLSILHFYKTVFGINGVFRYTTYVVAAVVVSFGIGVFLQEFLLCRPFAKNWNRSLPGVCGSSPATIVAEAVINTLIDIAIILLPMPTTDDSAKENRLYRTCRSGLHHLCDYHPSDRFRRPFQQ